MSGISAPGYQVQLGECALREPGKSDGAPDGARLRPGPTERLGFRPRERSRDLPTTQESGDAHREGAPPLHRP